VAFTLFNMKIVHKYAEKERKKQETNNMYICICRICRNLDWSTWQSGSDYTGVGQKSKPPQSTHNFVKYWPILKILSLSHSPGNLQ